MPQALDTHLMGHHLVSAEPKQVQPKNKIVGKELLLDSGKKST